jgi:hypothetical protein
MTCQSNIVRIVEQRAHEEQIQMTLASCKSGNPVRTNADAKGPKQMPINLLGSTRDTGKILV